jgi:hypothetical protein
MKKDEAGRPMMNEVAHSRPHSVMIVLCKGSSQDQSLFGSWQILELELHVVLKVQCHFGIVGNIRRNIT